MPYPKRSRLFGSPATRLAAIALLAVSLVLSIAAPSAALQKIPPSVFRPSFECGCHGSLIETWAESMHAQAGSDPIYRVQLAEANRATRGAVGPFCEACHQPAAAMGGLLGKKGAKPLQVTEGVNCDFCHQVSGTKTPLGNASFILRPDGARRAQLADAAAPSHRSGYSRFHETAEFCGTCHDVNHPGSGVALEATYTEWKNGPYPARGIVCQDCHMTPGPGVTRPNAGRAAPFGVERVHVYTMTFVGGNTALGPARLAEQRLRSAAEVGIDAQDIVAPGTGLGLAVSVKNAGAGHFLPTGVTDLRNMWLEVVATDGSGREILRKRRVFGTVFADAAGNTRVQEWQASTIAEDDRIAPGATSTERYDTEMPAAGPVKVVATLYYRSVPESVARKAGVAVPVTEMARREKTIYASREQQRQAAILAGTVKPGWPLLSAAAAAGIAVLGVLALVARRRRRA